MAKRFAWTAITHLNASWTRPRYKASVVLGTSFVTGAVPFSGLAARLIAGVDLRQWRSGTVSGTGLYEVAGFAPLAVAGSLDVAKAAVGPLLAGRERPALAALAGGLAVAGHNWSPLLGGGGGRGVAPALGATLVLAPEGTIALAAGLAGGRLVRQTGLGCLAGLMALFPLQWRRRGANGVLVAACVAVPMLAKRLAGNARPQRDRLARNLLTRLLFDRDPKAVGNGIGPVNTERDVSQS